MRTIVRTALISIGCAAAMGVMFDHFVLGSDVGPSTSWRLAIFATVIYLVISLFHRFYADPVRVMELSSKIHREAVRLSESSCTKFRLPDGDKRIAYLLIRVENDVVTIRCVTWSEYHGRVLPRYLVVGVDGLFSLRSKRGDVIWRYVLVARRLDGLVRFLRSCEPCSPVDQERVRQVRSVGYKSF